MGMRRTCTTYHHHHHHDKERKGLLYDSHDEENVCSIKHSFENTCAATIITVMIVIAQGEDSNLSVHTLQYHRG